MKEYFDANKQRWNELINIHSKSQTYDINGFLHGKNTLHSIELDQLGAVSGKSLLHLQCHFGLDSLSFARMGAEVTAVDFSDKAIELAKKLSKEIETPARFICANIYDLNEKLNEQFDIVFTSYGALMWLPDINGWAKIISRYLKKGGTFLIVEFHPISYIFNEDNTKGLEVKYPYFSESPLMYDDTKTYTDQQEEIENTITYEWQHTIGDIITSLISVGLRIENVQEYPFTVDQAHFKHMKKNSEGYWEISERDKIPLMFSIKATKK